MVFAVKDSPVYLEGAFDLVAAMVEGQPKVEAAFKHGNGVAWGESSGCLFCAVGAFFRPGYVNSIVQYWLPALDGVPKLNEGVKVADIGCGVGFSTLLMAKAFPKSRSSASTFTPPRSRRPMHMPWNTAWPIACDSRRRLPRHRRARLRPGHLFDCLHDMGDPRGCAKHVRRILKPGGSWMIVEPIAADDPAENIATRSAGSTTMPRP